MSNVLLGSSSAGGMKFTSWRITNGSGTEVLRGLGACKVISCSHVWESVVSPDQPKYLVDPATGEITVSAITAGSTGIVTAISR